MALGDGLNLEEDKGLLTGAFSGSASLSGANATPDRGLQVAEANIVTPSQSVPGPFLGMAATKDNMQAAQEYARQQRAGAPYLQLKMLIPK